MRMTFRWFGRDDPIPLAHIRHIPGVSGVVSALYDVPVGAAWTRERLERLKGEIEGAGLSFAVVESIPVHEDIKLGRPARERLIANYCESVRAMGSVRIPVLCYNFMPVFDWLRTDLAQPLADGSTALAYDDRALAAVDLSRGTGDLPGWATAYGPDELQRLLAAYRGVDLYAVLRALSDVGFAGPMRPDHGRMIWGERGRPGYGLFDRALGAMYLQGLWEGLTRGTESGA